MSNSTASIGSAPSGSSFIVPGSRLALAAVAADQRVGGAIVVELGLLGRLQLGDDPLRQHLAELDSPLVEGVDAHTHPWVKTPCSYSATRPPRVRRSGRR